MSSDIPSSAMEFTLADEYKSELNRVGFFCLFLDKSGCRLRKSTTSMFGCMDENRVERKNREMCCSSTIGVYVSGELTYLVGVFARGHLMRTIVLHMCTLNMNVQKEKMVAVAQRGGRMEGRQSKKSFGCPGPACCPCDSFIRSGGRREGEKN